MTRIISGVAGGRRLQTPSGPATRPTTDRVREALFSRLDHLGLLNGARVLDLYAGSGALGLEAASRGASRVLLVERDPAVAQVARRNVSALELSTVSVRAEPVERLLPGGPGAAPFDLVLADPPYDLADGPVADVLALLVRHQWLAPVAMVVLERSAQSPGPRWPPELELVDERRYGGTSVWFAGLRLPGTALLGSRHG